MPWSQHHGIATLPPSHRSRQFCCRATPSSPNRPPLAIPTSLQIRQNIFCQLPTYNLKSSQVSTTTTSLAEVAEQVETKCFHHLIRLLIWYHMPEHSQYPIVIHIIKDNRAISVGINRKKLYFAMHPWVFWHNFLTMIFLDGVSAKIIIIILGIETLRDVEKLWYFRIGKTDQCENTI